MTQLETTREDKTEFVQFFVYPLLFIVYLACLCLCVKKLIWNLRESKPIIKGLFYVNCLTFTCRVVYFLDFSFHYPDELYFFLDYWPFFTTATAAFFLVTSWLSLLFTIADAETAETRINRLHKTLLGLGAFMHLSYFVIYFAMFHKDRENLPVSVRVLMCFFELLAILSLTFVGRSLIHKVREFWENELTRKLQLMRVFGIVCFSMRFVINSVSLVISADAAYFVTYGGGYLWGFFLLVDYTFSEILFTFAVTHVIASQSKQRTETTETSLLSERRMSP
jgi:hypothetical protein